MSTERDDAEREPIAGARRADELDAEADESLRGMRAVWLSMREEDPPSGGLAELMAAARSQAMARKPAPWWQRALDAMRRPPVLALASAVILVGGAVVVGRELVLDRAPVDVSSRAPMDEGAQARPHEIEANGETKREAKRDGEAAGAMTAAPMPAMEPPPPPAVAAPAPAPARAASVEPMLSEERAKKPARKATADRKADPMPMKAPRGGHAGRLEDAQDEDAQGGVVPNAQGLNTAETLAAPPAPAAAPAAEAPKPATTSESAPMSLSAQLAACERAARRGDCAETQRLFKELARASNAYAMRASKDPAIARCLPAMAR